MRFERVVTQVFEVLRDVRLGSVVAVWADGGVSSHRGLGFRQRVLPTGHNEQPVATFVADGQVPSVTEIRERIKLAVSRPASD